MTDYQPQGPATPQAAVRVLQIIVFALVVGVLFFLGFALFTNKFAIGGAPDFLCYFGIGFALIVFVAHLVAPGVMQRTGLRGVTKSKLEGKNADQKFMLLFPHRQTATIIACALLEGAAFFNVFAYMRFEYLWSLVTVLVLVVFLVFRMPTLNSAQDWAEQRAQEIESGF